MNKRKIREGVHWLGAVHLKAAALRLARPVARRHSYNAYLVQGHGEGGPARHGGPRTGRAAAGAVGGRAYIDYVVSHHSEQDHSGSIGLVLQEVSRAKVIATPSGQGHAHRSPLPEDVFVTVADGEQLPLGGKTLTFLHTTMGALAETWSAIWRRSASSSVATSSARTSPRVRHRRGAGPRGGQALFAEIMAPFRSDTEEPGQAGPPTTSR